MGRVHEYAAEKDELIAVAERAGFATNGVEDHLLTALDANDESGSLVVTVAEKHARSLDEVAADKLGGNLEEIHLVGIAANGEQLLIDSRHAVVKRASGQQA